MEEYLSRPFVGAGSVFLNTHYEAYLLADINPDLIDFYNLLKTEPERLMPGLGICSLSEITSVMPILSYVMCLTECRDKRTRAALFLYLNRHGYNGLCRYNRKGGLNVPFGKYKRPYFPEDELWAFADKAQKATFICECYSRTFERLEADHVVYCDPPYVPLSSSANFTTYAANGFSLDDQALLARLARHTVQERQIPVLINNHATPLTYELYRGALLDEIQVKRTISRSVTGRNKVGELLALYLPGMVFDDHLPAV